MAEIDAKVVMELRAQTGAGMMDCKKALTDAVGDFEKAKLALRAKGAKIADKKAGRAAREGIVGTYIHHNHRLGVMAEVMCESDFVARNDEFKAFVSKLCKHIAAANPAPVCIRREQVPADLVASEMAFYEKQVLDKPEQIRAKITEGKLNAFYKERVLLEQIWSMDEGGPEQTVEQVLKALIGKVGENMVIRRFARFDIAEEVS
ncbi:MAG: translation elongation factor Ts [Planctomycetes bacterium]|nr:translation elongation factor Ts [Planctomycetota bacterium]